MKRKRLLPQHHTGKLVHRHHTNYGMLLLIVMLSLAPLFLISSSVAALSADPVTKSDSVYAVVPAPVPSKAPVIDTPADGQIFTTTAPVTTQGTCPDNTVVKVYKNQVMSGSVLCQNGRFALDIDLFVGSNSIIARASNINNISGPDSEPRNVKLELPNAVLGVSATGANSPDNQLLVTSDTAFRGVKTHESLQWPLVVSGGQAPYAVSVGWGDGKTDLISRDQAGNFTAEHTYDKPGTGYHNSYDVIIQATDQAGNKSFLHLFSIVSGDQVSAVGSIKSGYNWSSALRIAWQLVVVAGVVIFGFWFGEQYERRILKRKYNIAL